VFAPVWGAAYTFTDAQKLLRQYCQGCHRGKAAVGGFDLQQFPSIEKIAEKPHIWDAALLRVRQHEMPPKGAPAPTLEEREQFAAWLESTLRAAACAGGLKPGRSTIRRLNRDEYAATVRDLLNVHVNAGRALPSDGAGGEGFDNAAETLFLSPVHAEKYLEAAKFALEYGAKDPRSRARFLTDTPVFEFRRPQAPQSPEGARRPPPQPADRASELASLGEDGARRILAVFLPRAFRRPVSGTELERYLALYRKAAAQGDSFDQAVLFALQGVLISPHFLFRVEDPNRSPEPRRVSDYELASRLSYFLWGSMPDQKLFELAAEGRLHEESVLNQQVVRMLKDEKVLGFAESFAEQWLGTRELGRDIKPDANLFPEYYDAEIQSAIRYEPIIFFQEVFAENLSLLNFLDSKFTVLTNKLQRHYGVVLEERLRQQPKRVDLPDGTRRGGLLGMAAVLAVSSLPTRTSPVLRGKWVLDALLGTPPPPPPPDVPELEEAHSGEAPKTVRERLERHRQNPVCAGCHDRIDPIGFGLENFDVLGRWREEDSGKPIDAKGVLPDGTTFDGPEELKRVLLERRDLFVRNLTAKMLGYALGRGLDNEDYCTVDQIVKQVKEQDYRAHALVLGIVNSVPFRYKSGTNPGVAVLSQEIRR
jgi:hypothetical protein